MSRWVNGSLDDVLMVSVLPRCRGRPSARKASASRAPSSAREAAAAPAPAPFRSPRASTWPRLPAVAEPPRVPVELDELANEGVALGVRLLVLDSIATMVEAVDGEVEAKATLLAHTAALAALHEALDAVRKRAADARVSRVLARDAPLGAYVKGLYLRAADETRALERFGFHALEHPAEHAALAKDLDAASGFHFPDLQDPARAATSRPSGSSSAPRRS